MTSHDNTSANRLESVRKSCIISLQSILHVNVIRGRSLYGTDHFTKLDPYIKIKYGENLSTTIVHRRAGKDCEFDWSVSFPFDPSTVSGCPLEFVVMDKDTLRRDDEVGRATVTHRQIRRAETKSNAFDGAITLSRPGRFTGTDKPAGQLDVKYWWEFLPATKDFPTPVLHCVFNYNVSGGLVESLLDGTKFETFRTWQMGLWFLDIVFEGETCGWNKNYPAAQKIYGNNHRSALLRQTIRVQHSLLYSRDKKGTNYEIRMIKGSYDFINMLPTKDDTSGKSTRFTYVILQDSHIHFSRTSKRIGQDMLSKHALHACASETVVYAGEFFIDRGSERYQRTKHPALIIDNNSGTFAPPKEKLSKLKLLLELNLGNDVPVFALDREDPTLINYFVANDIE